MLNEIDRGVSVVLHFQLPEEVVEQRLVKRAREEGRADDTPENLKIAYQKDDLEEIFITIAEQPSRV